MDILLIVKSFIIGIVWGGSYLWIASIALHVFPLPNLLDTRRVLVIFAAKKYKKREALGERYWRIFVAFFKVCGLLLWLVVVAGFAYGLLQWMLFYTMPEIHYTSAFWTYFAIAAAPCTFFLLLWFVRSFIMGKRTSQLPTLPQQPEEDKRTLLEQIEG